MDDADFSDIENEDALDTSFKLATDFVTENASVMQQDDLLYLYGRYKQSTVGKCTDPMPGILKFRSRSKWSAWNALGDMSKEEAMRQYVDRVSAISPGWDNSDKKTTSKQPKKSSAFGPVTSICQKTDPELTFESKTVFDFVKEGNLNHIKELVSAQPGLVKECFDENGLSLLHWACDRGLAGVGEFLIEAGADVDCQDKDGQTPLHYASSCGHADVVSLLRGKGASTNVFDADGLSPADVAYSTNIKELLTMNAV